jgi:CheY-specific phosphatase CheX
MRAQLDEQCVIYANDQFWSQMLAMTFDPLPFTEMIFVGGRHFLASVDLTGGWRGRIEVRMAEQLAYETTAAMLMQTVASITQADVLDAAKEIANMIAGIIKSSLPRPCTMTVPQSVVEIEAYSSPALTASSMAVAFRHAAGGMMVRVSEQQVLP